MKNLRQKTASKYPISGCVIKKYREKYFLGHGGQAEFAKSVGVSPQLVSSWESGTGRPSRKNLSKIAKAFGIKLNEFQKVMADAALRDEKTKLKSRLAGLDSLSAPPDSQRMNVHKHVDGQKWWESDIQTWEVRGRTAGNGQQGEVVDDRGYADDAEVPPEGLTLVPVTGDSMSPVLLSGQYAMVDKRREGFEVQGGIVVVVTADEEGNFESRVKRCWMRGDVYGFTSINKEGNPPFIEKITSCRVWPVIGVWFAGKSVIPERDYELSDLFAEFRDD